jgi:hypothetical protein
MGVVCADEFEVQLVRANVVNVNQQVTGICLRLLLADAKYRCSHDDVEMEPPWRKRGRKSSVLAVVDSGS